MNTFTHLALAAIVTLAASGSPIAWSAEAQERAHCLSGRSQQDTATCLQEVQAASEESRRGGLGTAGDAKLTGNATDRCGAHPEADRAACIERVTAAGTAEGSVEGGGLIRRTETRVP
jgi:hypothetical protein